MKLTTIPLSKTNQFSKLMIDYINGEGSLSKFYKYPPKIEAFEQAILDRGPGELDRTLLVGALKKQYKRAGIEDVGEQVDALLRHRTFTVCTGHQLCIFTGPLYFIYKVITTINLAEALQKKYPDYHFVPVYWMASEDHDFEEIQQVHLFGKNVQWKNEEAKGAVGSLNPETLEPAIEELSKILGDSENSKELIALFRQAYLTEKNHADATRFLVHQLFKTDGLVIVDGDDPLLKKEFSEMLKDDILKRTNYELVSKTISELDSIGFKPQVSPREINCFYMKENIRERIVYENASYKINNQAIEFTKEELLEELNLHPERFSPNVVTRPIYQQVILPNLAYVGGPGEIAYWLEYKAMFDHHQVNFPILIPRNFVTLLDEKSIKNLTKMGLAVEDIFKSEETLIKELVKKNAIANLSLKEKEEKIEALYMEISTLATEVDASLKASVESEWKKVQNSIQSIENKMLRAEKQKQEIGVNQIKNIKSKFFPEGMLQERYENFAPYYLKTGKEFIAALKKQLHPFDFEMNLIEI